MTHFPDLTPMEHPQLIAVGWLARGRSYSQGRSVGHSPMHWSV
jgi:hypothetical protein